MRKPKTDSLQRELYALMNDRAWWSLAELAQELKRYGYRALDTTISARLRDLRKPPWNRMLWTRTREGTRPTVYEYSIQCTSKEHDVTRPPGSYENPWCGRLGCGEMQHTAATCPHADKGVRRA